MDNATYVALSRQLILKRELDVTANNIANMNTNGFKFEELLVKTDPAAGARNDPIRTPTNFALDHGVGRDFSQGAMSKTGNPFDLALQTNGVFFSLAGPNGTRLLTRNGSFTMGPDGTLQTQNGLKVQGDGGDIVIDPKKPAPSIAADGTISQGTDIVGKISLVRVTNLSALSKQGDGNFSLPASITPQAATDGQVAQGFVESSNVNPLKEITHLVEINRSYTTIANIISQNQDMNESAINRLGKAA